MAVSVLENTKHAPSIESSSASSESNLACDRQITRVLHVVNGEHYAGAERVQDLLAAGLPRHGFEVAIACLKPRQFPEMMQTKNVTLYSVPMSNRFDLRPAWQLLQIVRRGGYNILHAHSPRSLLLAAIVSGLSGAALVYHSHSPMTRDTTHRLKNRINALVERLAMAYCAAVIPVSHSLAGYVRNQGVRKSRTHVVVNGVARRPSRPVRRPGQNDWVIGVVALFRPRKGLEVLLQSIAELKSRKRNVRLRCVGRFETPEYERQIKRLVDELGISELIDWTGFTQDVDTELQKMDIFVLPSLFGEGLPMVVLEAMAAGVPVVASDVEGISETIRHAQDGLIVRPGDAEDLSAALYQIIAGECDWNSLRQSARRRHTEAFSDSAMTAAVADVYRRVLSERC